MKTIENHGKWGTVFEHGKKHNNIWKTMVHVWHMKSYEKKHSGNVDAERV